MSYRCCFQCGTASNDDFPWYADHPKLSRALVNKLGAAAEPHGSTYDNTDRFTKHQEGADYRLRPCGWKIAINPEHKFAHKIFVTYKWDANKLCWARRPMVLLEEKDRPIAVNDWYKLCQKVSNGSQQATKGYLWKREASWQQACRDVERNHPGATKSHIRVIVRKRILELSDRITADIMELGHEERGPE